jgi:hypothetical protein
MDSLQLPLTAGGFVTVQRVDEPYPPTAVGYPGVVTRGLGPEAAAERIERTFEASLDTIRTVAEGVVTQLDGLRLRPDTVTVDFGVALAAKAGTIITAGGSAHLQISLTWHAADAAGAAGREAG